jgi:hypothetical protein
MIAAPRKRKPVVRLRPVLALRQSELGQRLEQQNARMIAGERPPGPVRPVLARRQSPQCPATRRASPNTGTGLFHQPGMLGPARLPERHQPRA